MKRKLVHLGNGAHALATQILGSADAAADAVHDAYAMALKQPQAYDAARGSLKAWFLTVVRNRCIDTIRRRQPFYANGDEQIDPGRGPEKSLEILQRAEILNRALLRLKNEQRQIIVLRDYVDLSYAEIAGVLDIAPGTVMSRLHRARLALKEELIQHDI